MAAHETSLLFTCGIFSVLVLSSHSQSLENGGWGDWGRESACSRTCGGGVLYQERPCNIFGDDGSPTCVGPKKLYKSCNTEDCPEPEADFRAEQCERYNSVAFDGVYHEWIPYYGGKNCELNCLAKGHKFYYRHAAKVVDGTPCGLDTLDVCVDGQCQPVGCDQILHSTAQYDKCGLCGGDNSTCHTLEGITYTDSMNSGYNDVLLIPAGATSISIREESPTDSYLALRDLHGQYMLNGNWKINLPKPRQIGGTTFHYVRDADPRRTPETLSARGPTTEPLFIVILKQPGLNTGILYEYSIPNEVQAGSQHTYDWMPGEWSECSRTCGQGMQQREVPCKRSDDLAVVGDDLCDPRKKPEVTQNCNSLPCPAGWNNGEWSECSTSCGRGIQVRSVFCQQLITHDVFGIADDSHCEGYVKPEVFRHCNEAVECPTWDVEEWSQCNVACGPGKELRNVICRAQHALEGATSDILPDASCEAMSKPDMEQDCYKGPCEGLEWVISSWSGCPSICGVAIETRHIVCSSKSGQLFKDMYCDLDLRPDTSRRCPQFEGCFPHAQWHASQWSKCSAACGAGLQTRHVVCARYEDEDLMDVEDSECDPSFKMDTQQNCTGFDCEGAWFTGPFGKCSLPCGGGQSKREVLCFAGKNLVNISECDPQQRPDAFEDCNMEPCDDDNLIVIGGCRGTQHGCCPDQVTAAEGPDFLGCPAKDPIPRGACLESRYGCCLDGVSPAWGPFDLGCPEYTCKDTLYGCCKDGQTPAAGPDYKSCPMFYGCDHMAYGCCPDGVSSAMGPNFEGCPATTTPLPSCERSGFGCCPDGLTAANGPSYEGCEWESSGEVCEDHTYGCCPDGVTPASGPAHQGCPEAAPLEACYNSVFGCCPDGHTAAHGEGYHGCPGVAIGDASCENTIYGCCPDGEREALGPDWEGCGALEVSCKDALFGCCPDGETIAIGPDQEGCQSLCEYAYYGCCPDRVTEALGPNFKGCKGTVVDATCDTAPHGCCPDGTTAAHGPNYAGCNVTHVSTDCDSTTYGCCMDGQTVARGPNFQGCGDGHSHTVTCRDTPYKCCPNGHTAAEGPNFAGCPSLREAGGACALKSIAGNCTDYSVKWYFDTLLGDCSRFWYGGCMGNDNRFDTRDECLNSCTRPVGVVKCYLPRSVGRCRAAMPRFFYNPENRSCEDFRYGGCQGNNNNFLSMEECNEECVKPQSADMCMQPQQSGPCYGNFARWFYNYESGACQQFTYGGCMGNENRFHSELECRERCQERPEVVCKLSQNPGTCLDAIDSWFFNTDTKRCEHFFYGGCDGNANRFATQDECEEKCFEFMSPKAANLCQQPANTGPCYGSMRRWFHDLDGYCKEFIYGGCEGNDNRFETEADCRDRCNAKPPKDICSLLAEPGPCFAFNEVWHFDSQVGDCALFIYGGCQGNENRFSTEEECKKACTNADRILTSPVPRTTVPPRTTLPQTVDRCQQYQDSGPCLAYMPRWFYNADIGTCEQFIYGGCHGNQNRFISYEHCIEACRTTTELPSTTTEVLPTVGYRDQAPASCTLPMVVGSCEEYIPSWFYDTNSDTCQQFVYSGCDGNDNLFETEADCERTCSRKDICLMLKDEGDCRAYMPMWYYEANLGLCGRFIYGGCGGNANRFDNQNECEAKCGHHPTLGATTSHPHSTTTSPVHHQHSTTTPHHHHTTPAPSTTADVTYTYPLPSKTTPGDNSIETEVTGLDVCALLTEHGPCRNPESRWFYDMEAGHCKEFLYGGCRGNENNFLTREQCEASCPPVDICRLPAINGRCQASKKRYYFDAASGQCTQFVYGGCQGNANRFLSQKSCEEVCHRTVPILPQELTSPETRTQSTTRETRIQQGEDVCILPKEGGSCFDYSYKWFYDTEYSACRQFIYSGCGSNGNMFETEPDCQTRCVRTTTPAPTTPFEGDQIDMDLCTLPKDGGPCNSYEYRWYYNYEEDYCAEFIYGGCGGNANLFSSREECQMSCPQTAQLTTTTAAPAPVNVTEFTGDVCLLPSDIGPCYQYRYSWMYDAEIKSCREFVYGGCAGNGNNFESEEECRAACESELSPTPQTTTQHSGDICTRPADVGPCATYEYRWYHDSASGECRQFVYGGCDGNGNMFLTQAECQVRCHHAHPHTRAPTTTTAFTTPQQSDDICSLVRDPGPCMEYEALWYFEPITGTCRRFRYGGCSGNDNRFYSLDECEERCSYNTPGAETTTTAYWTPEPVTTPTTVVTWQPTRTTPRTTTEYIQETGDSTTVYIDYDVCELPMDPGPCRNDSSLQYYFDEYSGECQEFQYGGCGGNANRFTSLQKCERLCVYRHWKEICFLPKEPGPCHTKPQKRWFYDSDEHQCLRFTYGGCRGNGNRFTTLSQCRQVCALAHAMARQETLVPSDECELAPDMGPCHAISTRWYFDSQEQMCKDFVYGGCLGNANNFASKKKCQHSCRPSFSEEDICTLPVAPGPCQALKTRWFFDEEFDSCMQFTYGGCQGNANRFMTEEECHNQCGGDRQIAPVETGICELPKEIGPCFADMLRYYYDGAVEACRPFIYGGCQGNDNNFENERECFNLCNPIRQYNLRKPGDCFETPDPGPCDQTVARWFFDATLGNCAPFYYGGCEGNGNNFHAYDDCLAMCSRVTVTCGVLTCDLDCPFGFEQGLDGCPRCSCLDPCESHQCREDEQCQIEQEVCDPDMNQCPQPRPVCIPLPRDGECPALAENVVGTCVEECKYDVECPEEQKCCSNGCGHVCMDFEPLSKEVSTTVGSPTWPPYNSAPPSSSSTAVCPAVDDSWAGICVMLCDLDTDCPGLTELCCSNGCGQVCMEGVSAPSTPAPPTTTPHLAAGCAASVYGCCLDGVAPAGGYNYRGCPVEAPLIDRSSTSEMLIAEEAMFTLPCRARGAPTPQVQWYQDGFPILDIDENERMTQFVDGSLQIREVVRSDGGSYTCRAFNTAGEDTRNYNVRIQIAISFRDTPNHITRLEGESTRLECRADGYPVAAVEWLRFGAPLFYDGMHLISVNDGTILIEDLKKYDAGEYECKATNSLGETLSRLYQLEVLGPMTMAIAEHNNTYPVGDLVSLHCQAQGDGTIHIDWTREGEPIASDARVTQTTDGMLQIDGVRKTDAGRYVCTVIRGEETIVQSTMLKIEGVKLPANCTDQPWLANCDLILEANMCHHTYFKKFCCLSCYQSGQLP